MPTPLRSLRAALARFGRDTRGSASIETVLIAPFLFAIFGGSYVWFDAYRAQNTNLKAGYTISDMISRETVPIDTDYLNGLNRVYDFLTFSRHPTYLRVTSIKCTANCEDDATRTLEICWSWASTGRTAHTQATFAQFEDDVPLMPEGDTVILTETFMAYEPIANVGIPPQRFEYFVVTRPRFAPEVELVNGSGTDSCY